MIEPIQAPPYLAAFRFSGRLGGEDYDACIAQIESRLREYPRIAVYADLADMTGMSLEAIGKDFQYAFGKLGEYSRFARAAFVTDQPWLGQIGELAGRLLPRTEVRAFAPGEEAAAMAWAADFDADAADGGEDPAARPPEP